MNCQNCKKRKVCFIRDALWILANEGYARRNQNQTGLIANDPWMAPVDELGPQFCGNQYEEEMS